MLKTCNYSGQSLVVALSSYKNFCVLIYLGENEKFLLQTPQLHLDPILYYKQSL